MSQGKSGIRKLKPGEVLFNDGDHSSSLFIIQKGQIRLYKPKGKGFVEIAVLRAGEVIGEMAFFDKDNGAKRSCAAAALVSTEIIEISFVAFGKTFSSLNPWFKTIIDTLVKRLRTANLRIRELETNAGTVNYGKNKDTYEFLKTHDCLKILGTLFLVYKSHGEKKADGNITLHRRTIDLYVNSIYHLAEAKVEEVFLMLQDLGLLTISEDDDELPLVYNLSSLGQLQDFFIFLNTEKQLPDDKKLIISAKSLVFLEALYEDLIKNPSISETGMTMVRIDQMIANWKKNSEAVGLHQLDDPRTHKIVGEVFPEDDKMLLEVNFSRLQKMLPRIRFLNRMRQTNLSKAGGAN